MIALASSVVYSSFGFRQHQEALRRVAATNLSDEANILFALVGKEYEALQEDLNWMSRLPLFTRLRKDSSALDDEAWREILAQIFGAVLRDRSYYTQVRFIGVENGGKEVVRLDLKNDETVRTPDSELQDKSGEPYYRIAVDNPEAKVRFSPVTLNVEHGTVSDDSTPTLRALLPVLSDDGPIIGFIMINADYGRFLADAFAGQLPEKDIVVVDSDGHYMHFKRGDGNTDLKFRGISSDADEPLLVKSIRESVASRGLVQLEDTILYFLKGRPFPDFEGSEISVAVSYPSAELFAHSSELGRRYLLIVLGFLAFISLVATYFGSRLIDPVRALEKDVARSLENGKSLELSFQSEDELGRLASAFQSLTNQLDDHRLRLGAILDHIADGVIVVDAWGAIQSFNPACEALFGYSSDEMIGRNIKVLDASRGAMNYLRIPRTKTGELDPQFEVSNEIASARRKDGTTFQTEFSVTSLIHDDDFLTVVVVRDISERLAAEQMKSDFLGVVSHELRTPLTSIKGALSLVRSGTAGNLPDKALHLLNIAGKNASQLEMLVNDILDMQKLEAGRMSFDMQRCDLKDVIEEARENYCDYGVEFGITYQTQLPGHPVHAIVDQDRILQVLANFMSNAAKFSHRGDTIDLTMAVADGHARISVIDHGIGISEAAQATLFEKFTQAEPSASRKYRGTGLGLSIVKSIVEAHDGTLGVQSTPGQGSTFWFELPLAPAADAA